MSKLCEAAYAVDTDAVRACLDEGVDVSAVDAQGFTALHCVAMASNQAAPEDVLAIVRWLVEAGSPLEAVASGRTALFLMAEFSPSVEPVRYLLEAGADPRVTDAHGNTIVDNALLEDVQDLVSAMTGVARTESPAPEAVEIAMTARQWRDAQSRIAAVFNSLSDEGLVALQAAGYTQEDGFSDCVEACEARGGVESGLLGFCYYTHQDASRAKRTSHLSLAFWGAPAGQEADMQRVGCRVVEAFRAADFAVEWDGSTSTRPTLRLLEG